MESASFFRTEACSHRATHGIQVSHAPLENPDDSTPLAAATRAWVSRFEVGASVLTSAESSFPQETSLDLNSGVCLAQYARENLNGVYPLGTDRYVAVVK